jgi:hypothetical protein
MEREIIAITERRIQWPSQDQFPKLHLHWDTIKDPEVDEDTEDCGILQSPVKKLYTSNHAKATSVQKSE